MDWCESNQKSTMKQRLTHLLFQGRWWVEHLIQSGCFFWPKGLLRGNYALFFSSYDYRYFFKKRSISFISDKTVVLQHFQVEALLMCQSEKNQAVLCQLWPWHQDHLSRQENCLELTGKLHLNRKFADLHYTWAPTNLLINSFFLLPRYSSVCRLSGLYCN